GNLPPQRVDREVLYFVDGRVELPGSDVGVAPLRPDGDAFLRRGPGGQPRGPEGLGRAVRPPGVKVSNARCARGGEHLVATPLQFGDAAVDAEVAPPSEIDVRRSAERGEAKTEPAHRELR